MTVSYPRHAFEQVRRPTHLPRVRPSDRDKLTGIGITLLVHVLIVMAAFATVQVARPKVMRELSVQITPEPVKQTEVKLVLPKLAPPPPVTAFVPEFTVRTPPPPSITVQPAPAAPVPVQAAPAPQKAQGESRDAFLARLLDQLNRAKQYPAAARKAHIEGVVMLHFVMDANGKLLSSEIAKSSGRPVLDNEALALIQRAQLPALPPGFPTPTLDAVVPVQFFLNR